VQYIGKMFTAFALVKNLTSDSSELVFSHFKLYEIQFGDIDALGRAHKLFSVGVPHYGDWIYERSYENQLEKSLNDIEYTLFLLRLFKVGDLVFIRPCIEEQNGNLLRQLPYRIMSDIHNFHEYELNTAECCHFDKFYAEILPQKNWDSTWFQTARRFFLYGSSKEFNPTHNELDRIVDYIIAIESILVPEGDFIGRRLRERTASLLDIQNKETIEIIRGFYNLRSKIVHGDSITSKNDFLVKYNVERFEEIIRNVITNSLKSLPDNDRKRKEYLKNLFDVNDYDRGKKVVEDFRAIKDQTEQKKVFDIISKHFDMSMSIS
jgi:hypothetical protein